MSEREKAIMGFRYQGLTGSKLLKKIEEWDRNNVADEDTYSEYPGIKNLIENTDPYTPTSDFNDQTITTSSPYSKSDFAGTPGYQPIADYNMVASTSPFGNLGAPSALIARKAALQEHEDDILEDYKKALHLFLKSKVGGDPRELQDMIAAGHEPLGIWGRMFGSGTTEEQSYSIDDLDDLKEKMNNIILEKYPGVDLYGLEKIWENAQQEVTLEQNQQEQNLHWKMYGSDLVENNTFYDYANNTIESFVEEFRSDPIKYNVAKAKQDIASIDEKIHRFKQENELTIVNAKELKNLQDERDKYLEAYNDAKEIYDEKYTSHGVFINVGTGARVNQLPAKEGGGGGKIKFDTSRPLSEVVDISDNYATVLSKIKAHSGDTDLSKLHTEFGVHSVIRTGIESDLDAEYTTNLDKQLYAKLIGSIDPVAASSIAYNIKENGKLNARTLVGLANKLSKSKVDDVFFDIQDGKLILSDKLTAFHEGLWDTHNDYQDIVTHTEAYKEWFLLNRSIEGFDDPSFAEATKERFIESMFGEEHRKMNFNDNARDQIENLQELTHHLGYELTADEYNKLHSDMSDEEWTGETIGGLPELIISFLPGTKAIQGVKTITGLAKFQRGLQVGKWTRKSVGYGNKWKPINNRYITNGTPKANALNPLTTEGVAFRKWKQRYQNAIKVQGGTTLHKGADIAIDALFGIAHFEALNLPGEHGAGFAVVGKGLSMIPGVRFSGALSGLNKPITWASSGVVGKAGHGAASMIGGAELGGAAEAAVNHVVNNRAFGHWWDENYGYLATGEHSIGKRYMKHAFTGFALGFPGYFSKRDWIKTLGRQDHVIGKLTSKQYELLGFKWEKNAIKHKNGTTSGKWIHPKYPDSKKVNIENQIKNLSKSKKLEFSKNQELITELGAYRDKLTGVAFHMDNNLKIEEMEKQNKTTNKQRKADGKPEIKYIYHQKDNAVLKGRAAVNKGVNKEDGKIHIHVNLKKWNPGIIPHEISHTRFEEILGHNPGAFGKIFDAIEGIINNKMGRYIPGFTYREFLNNLYEGKQVKDTTPVERITNLIEFFNGKDFKLQMGTNIFYPIKQKIIREFEKGNLAWLGKTNLWKSQYDFKPDIDGQHAPQKIVDLLYRLAHELKDGNINAPQLNKLANLRLYGKKLLDMSSKKVVGEYNKGTEAPTEFGSVDFNKLGKKLQKAYSEYANLKDSNVNDAAIKLWEMGDSLRPIAVMVMDKHKFRPGFETYKDLIEADLIDGPRGAISLIRLYNPESANYTFRKGGKKIVVPVIYNNKGEVRVGKEKNIEELKNKDRNFVKKWLTDKYGKIIGRDQIPLLPYVIQLLKERMKLDIAGKYLGVGEGSTFKKSIEETNFEIVDKSDMTGMVEIGKTGKVETPEGIILKNVLFEKSLLKSEEVVTEIKEEWNKLYKNYKDFSDTKVFSYKNIKDLTPVRTAELFGVDYYNNKGEVRKGDLNSGSVRNAQEFINNNTLPLIALLAKGHIESVKDARLFSTLDKSTGVEPSLLKEKSLYTKISDKKHEKNEKINPDDFKKVFGINKDGSFVPLKEDRNLSAKIKAIVNQTGKALTIQSITDHVKSGKAGVSLRTAGYFIKQIESGKSEGLASFDINKFFRDFYSLKPVFGLYRKERMINFIDKYKDLPRELKELLISDLIWDPKYIETKETESVLAKRRAEELGYDIKTLESIRLDTNTQWKKFAKIIQAEEGLGELKINAGGGIVGVQARKNFKAFSTKFIKSFPDFATLSKPIQQYILDTVGITYVKFYKNTADLKNKDIPGERWEMIDGDPIKTVETHFGKDALKGTGTKNSILIKNAYWSRNTNKKQLTELGFPSEIIDKLPSLKQKSSPDKKEIVADLLDLYLKITEESESDVKGKGITKQEYLEYSQRLYANPKLLNKYSTYKAMEKTQASNKAMLDVVGNFIFQSVRKSGKNKTQVVSDVINLMKVQTNIAAGIFKGAYTTTSVPLSYEAVEVREKLVRTHNEHALQLLNYDQFLVRTVLGSNAKQFKIRMRALSDMAEQAVISKKQQVGNDSGEFGNSTGMGKVFSKNLAGWSHLIYLTKLGEGNNQLYLLAEKPMTINEYIVDKIGSAQQQRLLKIVDRMEKTTSSVDLKNKIENIRSSLQAFNATKKFADKIDVHLPKNITKEQLIELINERAQAIAKTRDINAPKKGASILDFDDTVGKTKSFVKYEIPRFLPDGRFNPAVVGYGAIPTKGKLTPLEFAKQSEQLEKYGAKFDYSDFTKIKSGKPGPLFAKLVKIQEKYGTENAFILTARPQEAAPAIQKFLKGLGVNIPLKNIIGLEDGRPGAKANFIVKKASEGYNDIYFVDDAIQNVRAVKNVLKILGIDGKTREVREYASLNLNKEFNKIIEETTGIEIFKKFTKGTARTMGADIGKWKWWLPPSAEGFLDLMYPVFGKGKQGDRHMKWFDTKLGRPYAKGFYELNKSKQRVHDDYQELKKQYPEIKKIINKKTNYHNYTYDAAIRVYLWKKYNMEIPELSKTDIKELIKIVKSKPELELYANEISRITQLKEGYVQPAESWLAKSIQHDLLDVSNKVGRKEFYKEWINNKNEIFTEETLNKLESAFGTRYREALEDMLFRMENGMNKQKYLTSGEKFFNKWVANAVGTIMFLNRRSALLQTISSLNFTNWSDNNPLKIGARFADQKQFWKDFTMIFNSPMLKQRRRGLTMDVNYEEMVNTIQNSKDKVSASVAYLLNKGFIFTKYADNFAIAFGGAAFYRNRLNTYLKHTKDKVEAKKKAFLDFQEASEPTQQSSRPDLISQQQSSSLGKFFLNFQNVTTQNNRNGKRAILDFVNRRGDMKTNLSKIVYYFGVQNIIFLGLQQALFAAYWDPDATDEDINDKAIGMGNGILDVWLRGGGIVGVGLSTLKNTILKYMEESEKGWKGSEAKVIISALNFSPPVSSKVSKIHNAMLERKFNKGSVLKPAVLALEGATNVPFNEFYQMTEDAVAISTHQLENWQKIAIALGYPEWQVDYQPPEIVKPKSSRGIINRGGVQRGTTKRGNN